MLKVTIQTEGHAHYVSEELVQCSRRMSLEYAALLAFPVFLPDKNDETEEGETENKVNTHKVRILVPNIEEIMSK